MEDVETRDAQEDPRIPYLLLQYSTVQYVATRYLHVLPPLTQPPFSRDGRLCVKIYPAVEAPGLGVF